MPPRCGCCGERALEGLDLSPRGDFSWADPAMRARSSARPPWRGHAHTGSRVRSGPRRGYPAHRTVSPRGPPGPPDPGVPHRGHAHVDTVPPNPARGPCRRRGAEPPAAGPGRLHPPGRPGDLHMAAAGAEDPAPRRADRPRGDGRDRRPGAAVPRPAAAGAVRGERPLDRVRGQHLPAQGPQGRRLPARTDPRGAVRPHGQGPVLVLQGPAGHPLPDPEQVPRRGPSAGGDPARPRVRHEGRVLLRHRRRRAAEELRPAA